MSVIDSISQVGSDVIRAVAEPVALPLDDAVKQIIADLVDTMRASSLVGMAAPQIGQGLRIFVTELRETRFRSEGLDALRVFINPAIVSQSAEQVLGYEGCGSVAHSDLFGEVSRAASVTVRYMDEVGVLHEDTFNGFLARVIQHEMDHLNGVVFLDKLATTLTVKSANEFRKPAS